MPDWAATAVVLRSMTSSTAPGRTVTPRRASSTRVCAAASGRPWCSSPAHRRGHRTHPVPG
jgi:hypothetical protein